MAVERPASDAAYPQRITFEGNLISSTIQTDKCFGCGMGLCDPREWHPQLACDTYTSKHDSRAVWRKLWAALRARDEDVAGADRLHDLLYPKVAS